MKRVLTNGATSVITRVKILDTSGNPKTGLTNGSAGLVIAVIAANEAATTAYTQAGATIDSITTLGTYAAPTAGHCRFREVDATNHPGLYEIQIADARFAVVGARNLIGTVSGVSGISQCDFEYQLTASNLDDNVHLGLTSLPNATASAAGGLLTVGSNAGQILPADGNVGTAGFANALIDGNGFLKVDVADWGGAAVAGMPLAASAYVAPDNADIVTILTDAAALVSRVTGSMPTAGQIATAVWTDVVGADFTADGSPGKQLMGTIVEGLTVPAAVQQLLDIAQADYYLDQTGSPYKQVLKKQGTGTTLLTRRLLDANGDPITSTSTVVAQGIQ